MWKPLRMTWENKQNFRALLETIRKTGFEGKYNSFFHRKTQCIKMSILPQIIYTLINEFSSFIFWGIADMFGILSTGSLN